MVLTAFSFQTTVLSCADSLHGNELLNLQIVAVLFLEGDN